MSYIRVRSRSSRRLQKLKSISISDQNLLKSGPFPTEVIESFLEDNPNASESQQIEELIGIPFIPEFKEKGPNLINTSPEIMSGYNLQRQLIDQIRAVKRQKLRALSQRSPPFRWHLFSSEPFVTVLIKIISNHKPSKEDIYENLKHLGRVREVVLYFNGNDFQMAFVRFESSAVASDLCKTSDRIKFNYGLAKNVSIKTFPKRSISSEGGYELISFMRPIDRQILAEKVRNAMNCGKHFDVMKEYLLLTENDRQNRLNLCHKLETILNNNQIYCKFHVLGSTVNGLGFCDSDIDIFIEIYNQNNFRNKMALDLALKYLDWIRNVLGKALKMYINPLVASRRCPLIKLDFRQFSDSLRSNGISCDLSLVNSLGIQNSKLIAFYCKLEPRFQTLAVVLRYLAKIKGFIGSSQMSSYAFSMLIIFFSQRLSVQLLPTVQQLVELKTERYVINGLDCGFCDDVDRYRQSFPHIWDECSINYLFHLFFQFYKDFDFESRVICPRNGTAVRKTNFDKHLKFHNNSYDFSFKMTPFVCIQDPFDPTFNMTHHMPHKLFLELKAWFKSVAALTHHYFSEEPPTDPNQRTFTDLLEPTIEAIEEIKELIIEDTNEVNIIKETKIVEKTSKYLIGKLTTNFDKQITAKDINRLLEDWGLSVGHFFRRLFREGFKMECIYNNKTEPLIDLNKVSTFDSFIIKFNTTERRVIDLGIRQSTLKEIRDLSFEKDFIKRERLITEAVIENGENCLIIDENSVDIRVELELTLEPNKQIYLNITDIHPKDTKQVQSFIDFISDTFRSGLEAQQMFTIDDSIIFYL